VSNLQRLEDARSILHQGNRDYNAFLAIIDEHSIMHYQGAGLPFSMEWLSFCTFSPEGISEALDIFRFYRFSVSYAGRGVIPNKT